MKLTYTGMAGRLVFELEATGVKDAFMKISMLADAFEADIGCGLCHSPDIRFEHRKTQDGYTYYALRCNACNAELSFGQARVGGGLFVKRDKGTPESRGWYMYDRTTPQHDDGWNQDTQPPHYNQQTQAPAQRQHNTPPMQSGPRRQAPPPANTADQISDDDVPF